MKIVEDIFFSGTFGGETLSLAAAKAVINKMINEPVIETIKIRGEEIIDGLKQLITRLELTGTLSVSGHPSWSFLKFRDIENYSSWEIKTFFLQEVFKRGIYTLGTHNLSYAHSKDDVERLLACYDAVFETIAESILARDLRDRLECKPLEPLFKVR